MALYRGVIRKYFLPSPEETWENVYMINEVNALEALDVLNAIMAFEAAVHTDTVGFIGNRATNIVNKNDSRSVVGALTYGDRSVATLGQVLPLWNCMRVVISSEGGRPEQKYLRLPLYEANSEGFNISGELVTYVQDNYVVPLLAMAQYVGPSGEAHSEGQAIQRMQMRQLGWHRRTRPGFRRGWVPV